MYKNQFEIWGFAKNLTKNRIKSLLRSDSIKGKVANGFSAARIDRYLKRRKASQPMPVPDYESFSAMPVPDCESFSAVDWAGVAELDCEFAEVYELDSRPLMAHECPAELDSGFTSMYKLETGDENFHEPSDTSIDTMPVTQSPVTPAPTRLVHRPDTCVFSERGSRKYVIVVDAGSSSVSS